MIKTEFLKHNSFPNHPSGVKDSHHFAGTSAVLYGGKTDMLTSKEVVQKLRLDLRHLDDQIHNHEYFKLLKTKKVDLCALRAFPGYQYHIINSDLRSLAMMIHRFNRPLVQSFFVQVFQGEHEALTNLSHLAQRLGMSGEELQRYPLTPEGFAYATYMGWLAMYGSAAEIVAGFLVNFSAWKFNCAQMSQSLKAQYGFTPKDTEFLDAFAALPSFEPAALDIIQDGLDEGVAPWRIQRAAFLFQGYEIMFWDTLANIGTV